MVVIEGEEEGGVVGSLLVVVSGGEMGVLHCVWWLLSWGFRLM
jgi:hypothetical protein